MNRWPLPNKMVTRLRRPASPFRRLLLILVLGPALSLAVTSCTDLGAWDLFTKLENEPWVYQGWSYRRRLVFDNKRRSEDLSDFPVLVKLQPSRVDYGAVRADGADLRFVDAEDGTELSHEVELWVPGGTSYVWVRVPRIDGDSNIDYIYFYYGNPTASDVQDPTGVWDAGFRGVWHLGSDADDSTIHANHGVSTGTDAPGPIGTGELFDGATTSVAVADASSLDITDAITMEAWVKKLSTGSQAVFGKYRTPPPLGSNYRSYKLEMDDFSEPINRITFWISGDGTTSSGGKVTTSPSQIVKTWYYVVGVSDTVTQRIYVDGQLNREEKTDQHPILTTNEALTIGAQIGGGGEFLDGAVDEVRLSAAARSAGWISAQYDSMRDKFITWGPQETQR